MRPIRFTRTLTAADADGIAQAQTTGGAADLILNGVLVTSGVARLDAQRKVAGASTGNIAAVVFTVYGTDQTGNQISEAITGINNNSVSTTLDFYTVTRIAASATVGTAVEFGTTEVGAAVPVPLDQYLTPFNVSVALNFSGTANATLQYTLDDVFASTFPSSTSTLWINHSTLASVSADAAGTFIAPVCACRLVTNSGTGSVQVSIVQAGI